MAIVGTNRAGLTTRMPEGLTNAATWQTMGLAGLPDPTWAHTYAQDFDQYVAADWSLTGTGTPAAALVAGNGGILQLATTAGATDASFLQKTPAAFAVNTANKQTFFKFGGTPSSAAGAFYCGLAAIGSGAESALVNGIVLYKAAGAATIVLDIIVASAHTTFAFPAACVVTAATFIELGFAVDAVGNVLAFWNPTTGYNQVNGGVVGSVTTRGCVAVAAAPTLPAVNMAPIVGYTNNSAVAQTVNIDFLVASTER
jgi:hypothetical protein